MVVVAALAGCGGKPAARAPSPTPKPPSDRQLIARALRERATAAGARGLGLRHPRWRIERVRIAGRRARILARRSYGIRGVRGDFGSEQSFAARKRNGRWHLRADDAARGLEPWEVDDYTRDQSRHFVVLTPKGIAAPVDSLEAGYGQLRDTLTAGLRRRYLVVVARDGPHARRLTQSITGLESLTAVTDTQVRVRGRALRVVSVGAQRLLIVLPAFLAAPDQTQVIAHELAHAALAPTTSGRAPAWLVEGVALYASADDRRGEYASLTTVPTLAGLSAPDAIARMGGEGQRSAYATSSVAAFAIADRYGSAALLKVLHAYNRTGIRGRRGDPELTDRVLRRTLGISLTALQNSLG